MKKSTSLFGYNPLSAEDSMSQKNNIKCNKKERAKEQKKRERIVKQKPILIVDIQLGGSFQRERQTVDEVTGERASGEEGKDDSSRETWCGGL